MKKGWIIVAGTITFLLGVGMWYFTRFSDTDSNLGLTIGTVNNFSPIVMWLGMTIIAVGMLVIVVTEGTTSKIISITTLLCIICLAIGLGTMVSAGRMSIYGLYGLYIFYIGFVLSFINLLSHKLGRYRNEVRP